MLVKKPVSLWGNSILGPGSVCKCALEAEGRRVTDPSAAGRAADELQISPTFKCLLLKRKAN